MRSILSFCCLEVVGAALDFCGQLPSCRPGLAAAVGAFAQTTQQRLQEVSMQQRMKDLQYCLS